MDRGQLFRSWEEIDLQARERGERSTNRLHGAHTWRREGNLNRGI